MASWDTTDEVQTAIVEQRALIRGNYDFLNPKDPTNREKSKKVWQSMERELAKIPQPHTVNDVRSASNIAQINAGLKDAF